jgi:hypothetical protein
MDIEGERSPTLFCGYGEDRRVYHRYTVQAGMWWSSNGERGCDGGEAVCGCTSSADAVWKSWKDVRGMQTCGFAVKDVTQLVEGCGDGPRVHVQVQVAAAVFAGTQSRSSVGWYSTFLLSVPAEAGAEDAVPNGIAAEFPLVFRECKSRAAFCFPSQYVASPSKVWLEERHAVGRDRAKRWTCTAALRAEDVRAGAYRWVVCVVFMMQDCMEGTLGMNVRVEGT